MRRIITAITILLAATALCHIAAQERPVSSAVTAEAGSAHMADTYLSPLRYTGWHTAVTYDRFQAMRFNPDHWLMNLLISGSIDGTHNPAHNARMTAAMVTARWGMMHKWHVAHAPGLTLAAGGFTGIDAGAWYLSRNGNNPVSARAAWNVGVTGLAAYSTRLGRLPLSLRYQATVPLTGVFFSPVYDELYYEIYLGNHSGLVHGAWPGNRRAIDNVITADLQLGRTALRLGYHNTMLSRSAANITTRHITHSLILGVAYTWTCINTAANPAARIITAY